MNNGHTFLPEHKLADAAARLLEQPQEELEERLEKLIQRGEVVEEEWPGSTRCTCPVYEAEVSIAQRLEEMSQAELLPPRDLDKIIQKIQKTQGITYAPQQRQAVEQAAPSPGDAPHRRAGHR